MPIKITAKQDGFRRCGIAHSKEPTIHPDDRFTKTEIKVLKAEPMLVVEETTETEQETPVKKVKKEK